MSRKPQCESEGDSGRNSIVIFPEPSLSTFLIFMLPFPSYSGIGNLYPFSVTASHKRDFLFPAAKYQSGSTFFRSIIACPMNLGVDILSWSRTVMERTPSPVKSLPQTTNVSLKMGLCVFLFAEVFVRHSEVMSSPPNPLT